MSGTILKRAIGVFFLTVAMTAAAPVPSMAAPAVVKAPAVVAHTQLIATPHAVTAAAVRPTLEIRALRIAESKIGDPYRWGATGPNRFDCSGLVYYSYIHAGKHFPRWVRDAASFQSYSQPISRSHLRVGDLVFFGSPAYHIGIYVGNGKFLNAPHSGDSVEIDPIWYDGTPSGYGRIN